jgi:hypothetical protein
VAYCCVIHYAHRHQKQHRGWRPAGPVLSGVGASGSHPSSPAPARAEVAPPLRHRCPTSTAVARGGQPHLSSGGMRGGRLLSGGGARRPATPLQRRCARRPVPPLRRLHAEAGHTSPAPAREEAGPSGTPAFPDSAGSGRIQRGAARCDNPPRKILYYRLRPIHFGH